MSVDTLSVLHLASFQGNAGDVLNHIGFRPWFEELIPRAVAWTDLEIRGYFRHEWEFDESFFDLVNSYDLLVIGGGNYFELWPQRSRSGTSVDLLVEDFDRIRVPVFFNALGVDAGQGVSPNAGREFPRLIAYLTANDTMFVSVRNDGAIQQITDLCGVGAAADIIDLPDAAFFLPDKFDSDEQHTVVGVNLACDMPSIRFAHGERGSFVNAVASALTNVRDFVPEVQFRVFAHVFSDFTILADLLDRLPDPLRRESVEVYGCAPNSQGALAVAAGYSECAVVIGTRFHSNVLAIGQGIPSVGLDTYPQIRKLFTDLGLSDWCIDGHDTDSLSASLVSTTQFVLEAHAEARTRVANVRHALEQRRATAAEALRGWLTSNRLT